MQPIWVEDLAPMLVDGIEDGCHGDESYEIGGPEQLTFAEIVESICDGVSVIPVPMSVSSVAFSVANHLPAVPFGRDQYRVLQHDNTTETNDVAAFGLEETELRPLGDYLHGERR